MVRTTLGALALEREDLLERLQSTGAGPMRPTS